MKLGTGRSLGWCVFAGLLSCSAGAWAHGEALARSPWLDGAQALWGDPPSLLLLAVLALGCAQQGRLATNATPQAYGAGLVVGAMLAATGWGYDASLVLLTMTLVLGLLVAWARPWPAPMTATVAASAACAMVLMLAPAPTESLGFRLAWLAGVLMMTALLFAVAYRGLLAAAGRKPGAVQQLLLRVAGSWLATAAVLVLVLELQARAS